MTFLDQSTNFWWPVNLFPWPVNFSKFVLTSELFPLDQWTFSNFLWPVNFISLTSQPGKMEFRITKRIMEGLVANLRAWRRIAIFQQGYTSRRRYLLLFRPFRLKRRLWKDFLIFERFFLDQSPPLSDQSTFRFFIFSRFLSSVLAARPARRSSLNRC